MSQLERREEGHVTVLAWDQPSGERREVEVSGRRLKIVDHGRGGPRISGITENHRFPGCGFGT